jgi:nitroreductase/NAD-dependent dihydropyrimidine dehydrogenase PreA subunit
MGKIVIDAERCTGCGQCVEICAYKAIAVFDQTAEYNLDDCFLCGHCQAICPEGAVTIRGLGKQLGLKTVTEEVAPFHGAGLFTAGLVTLMRSRRSCRKYHPEEPPYTVLEDLVKIGTTAPSGTNSQGWSFAILATRQDLVVFGGLVADYYRRLNVLAANPVLRFINKLFSGDSLGRYWRRYANSVSEALKEWDEGGADRLFHGAPAAILVSGKKEASCPAEDALLATQNILLAAEAMGLGSCLIGFAVEAVRRDRRIRSHLNLAFDEELYSVIVLGYPAVQWQSFAGRKPFVCRQLHLAKSPGSDKTK